MTTVKLPASLEAHRHMAAAILSWMPDWLDQNAFDKKAEACREGPKPISVYIPDPFLLGDWLGCSQELGLLQHLVALGLVQARARDDGLIEYRRRP